MTTFGCLQETPAKATMRFEMIHKVFKGEPEKFSNLDAPDWLTSENTIPGSTADDRWFWKEHVLTLAVGESTETDFHVITRVV